MTIHGRCHRGSIQYVASVDPEWTTVCKRAETRAARLAKLVEACAAGQRLR